MSIQWYPGHMAKAKREMAEKIKLIDCIIEVTDARIPESSRNPLLAEIGSQKPRLLILNKNDMADPEATKRWVDHYENQGIKAILTDSQKGTGTKSIPQEVEALAATSEKKSHKMRKTRVPRALIAGIPNVGKSTLINRLSGKRSARIGDRPGVTKGQQWIKVGNKLELLDTPGILWPKFEPQEVGYRLAATGAIKDHLLNMQDIAVYLLNILLTSYPGTLEARYGISETHDEIVELFDAIGKRRGCLMAGGLVDYDKVSDILVRDYRTMKLGRVTLETPEA